MAFPQTANPIMGELYVGSLGWVDITSDVRQGSADSGGGITITRGRSSEGNRADPGRCSFVLNNRHGRYSPRNPRSPYFGLIGRNTPVRFYVPRWSDSFNRTVSGGMGTSDDGLVWSVPVPAQWSVSAGKATTQFAATNTVLGAYLNGTECVNSEQVVDFTIPAVMTGASLVAGVVARYTSANGGSYYWLRTEFDVAGVVRVKISNVVNGTFHELGTASTGLTYSAGSTVRMRASVVGKDMAVKVWKATDPEPADWHLCVSDNGVPTAGRVGIQHWLVAGNTNSPIPSVSASNYRVVRPHFLGEISAWPPRWDLSGRDVWVPIEASGIFRRLNQGGKALRSPLFRNLSRYNPTLYLPLEDGSDSDAPTNAVAGGQPGLGVDLTFGADDSLPGATTTAKLGSSTSALFMKSKPTSGNTYWSFLFYFKMDSLPSASGELLEIQTSGKVTQWSFNVSSTEFRWIGTDKDDNVITNTANLFTSMNLTGWVAMELLLRQNGSNVEWNTIYHQVGSTEYRTFSGGPFSYAGTIGYPTFAKFATPTLPPTALGHVAVFPLELPMLTDAFRASSNGYVGESAGARVVRLGAEEGVSVGLAGDPADTTLMGRQKADSFLSLLEACAAADGGILHERRNALGLVYRSRASLYNQTPVALSYASKHISEPFEPVEDDDALRNDVTVTRDSGASARYVLETGPLSVQTPPYGVGTYDESVTLNLASDSQAPEHASWRVHLGTADEARYPSVRVNLAHPAWSSDLTLTDQATAVDSGDLLSIDDLPDWLPPGPIKLLVQGYTERLDAHSWDITWNATPGSVWDVAVYDDATLGRIDADGSTVYAAVNEAATNIPVTPCRDGSLWITSANNPEMLPVDVVIGGERIKAVAIYPAVYDGFDRVASSGWGTATTGQAWTTTGGSASDYSVGGG